MADSPLQPRSRNSTADSPMSGRIRSGPTVVRPQQVTEQSLMESVAGFINEVQSYNQPHNDPKSQIIWAKFEQTDINDPALFPQNQDVNGNSLSLLLILGYTQGIQVWCIPGSGEAQLVLSWFHGQVKCLKILPSPETNNPFSDPFNPSRPLVAICDSSGPGTAFMSLSFLSLATGEQVSSIKFNNEIVDVLANRRVICVAFKEKVAVFSALTFKECFTLTSCYPSPGVHSNPLALHTRWLAYADKTLCQSRRSSGGMEGDVSQSTVTAWGINVGSKLASGVAKVCSNIFSGSPKATSAAQVNITDGERGVVTVLDTVGLNVGEDEDMSYDLQNQKMEGVVAHFVAHNKAIVALQFDPSGSLLLTADKPGNSFHVFRIVAHPLGSCYAAVHHLYSLYRGDTPGSVQDIAFSADSRWVTVSTLRGTTHIFPICPYGGPVSVRTHTSHRVVNKLSRFHRSAGLNENPPSSGRSSPNPNLGSSPANSSKSFDFPPGMGGSLNLAYPCPHLPPYPTPTLIQPVAQLRQPYIVTITSSVTMAGNRKAGKKNSAGDENPIRVVAAFAPSRARTAPGLHSNAVYSRTGKKAVDSLFVMANHGQLLEYTIEPTHDQTIPRDKVCESSPIELHVTAFGQWNLFKPLGKERNEVAPPLSSTNPLLLSRIHNAEDEGWNEEDEDEDERWLSQVEILTHIGPARRLWMGPQFSFRPFQKPGCEDELKDLDVTVACRPRSDPVQMPGGGVIRQKPVYIECGSANSFELSPRFANTAVRGSQEQVHMDVEKEINEAMSDTVNPKQNQGELRGGDEFFCITTEEVSRSRSGSSVSQPRSRHSSSIHRGVEMVTAETKIFSVAVQQGKAKNQDNYVYKDVENQLIDRPVILGVGSSKGSRIALEDSGDEFQPVYRDPTLVDDEEKKDEPELDTPVLVDTGSSDLVLDKPLQEQGDPDTILSEIQSAISQDESGTGVSEPKKKSKKKKGRTVDLSANYSSADEMKEVETKTKKKRSKNKEKEEEKKTNEETKTKDEDTFDADFPSLGSVKTTWKQRQTPEKEEKTTYRSKKSAERDLMDLTGDDSKCGDEDEDSEKVEFFVRERSSSLDSEVLESATRVNPYGAKPQQSPWMDKILKSGTSLIEDQISGAVRKYEDIEDKGSEDEEMKEFDKEDVVKEEDNSPHLLEEDDIPPLRQETVVTKLSQLLKFSDDEDQSKPEDEEEKESKEDDFFAPVISKRSRRKQKNLMEDSSTDFEGWQEADPDPEPEQETKPSVKDGWSFEVDEDDVNKLLSQTEDESKEKSEERIALEDVFRFDSEMAREDDKDCSSKVVRGHRVSVEDLSDALRDETDSENETGGGAISQRWDTSTDDESVSCGEADKASNTGTSSCSEGSVTNSPNPWATKSKGRKNKKKKR